MYINISGLTDIGLRRNENQDAISWYQDNELNCGYLLVADGMGGYTGGAVAAQAAVTVMEEALPRLLADPRITSGDQLQQALRQLFATANQHILELKQQRPELSQMGTTAALALVWRDRIVTAHIGDSRVYLWRPQARELIRLTRDHSVVEELLASGAITPEQAATSSQRNVLTQALGVSPQFEMSISERPIERHCLLLVCSDGLSGPVEDGALAAELERHLPVLESCYRLVQAANSAGGHDNISVVIGEIALQR